MIYLPRTVVGRRSLAPCAWLFPSVGVYLGHLPRYATVNRLPLFTEDYLKHSRTRGIGHKTSGSECSVGPPDGPLSHVTLSPSSRSRAGVFRLLCFLHSFFYYSTSLYMYDRIICNCVPPTVRYVYQYICSLRSGYSMKNELAGTMHCSRFPMTCYSHCTSWNTCSESSLTCLTT